MARYVRDAVAGLRRQSIADLLAGRISFRLPDGRMAASGAARRCDQQCRAEFSRLVPLARLGSEPFGRRSRRPRRSAKHSPPFGLLALDRLAASSRFAAQGRRNDPARRANSRRNSMQCCAVTLEPVRGAIAERFSLLYGPAAEAESGKCDEAPTSRPSSRSPATRSISARRWRRNFRWRLPEFPASARRARSTKSIPSEPAEGSPFAAPRALPATCENAEARAHPAPDVGPAAAARLYHCCRSAGFWLITAASSGTASSHRVFMAVPKKKTSRRRAAICGARITALNPAAMRNARIAASSSGRIICARPAAITTAARWSRRPPRRPDRRRRRGGSAAVSDSVTIALDAMGGDHAPGMVVKGAEIALQRHPERAFPAVRRRRRGRAVAGEAAAARARSATFHHTERDGGGRREAVAGAAHRRGSRACGWRSTRSPTGGPTASFPPATPAR